MFVESRSESGEIPDRRTRQRDAGHHLRGCVGKAVSCTASCAPPIFPSVHPRRRYHQVPASLLIPQETWPLSNPCLARYEVCRASAGTRRHGPRTTIFSCDLVISGAGRTHREWQGSGLANHNRNGRPGGSGVWWMDTRRKTVPGRASPGTKRGQAPIPCSPGSDHD